MCEHILSEKRREELAKSDPSLYFYGIIKSLAECCGKKPYFIDFGNIEGIFPINGSQHPLEIYFETLRFGDFVTAVPVTGLNRSDSYQSAVLNILKQPNNGVCLRLSANDVRDPSLVPLLQLFLRRFQLKPEFVDLLVDLKSLSFSSPSIEEICNRLPMLEEWRTFTGASGAFPNDLSEFDKNGEYEVFRTDWFHWLRGFNEKRKLKRIPTFSDYTIQSPRMPKPLDFIPNVSASIRYTSKDHWVIMRGEGLRNPNGAKFDQYWGQANSLMYREEYSGEDFSFGDQYISKIGSQTQQTGNPNTWLKAGINRHMTFVARQISQITSSGDNNDAEFGGRLRRPPLPRIWNQSRLVLPDSVNQGYLFPPFE